MIGFALLLGMALLQAPQDTASPAKPPAVSAPASAEIREDAEPSLDTKLVNVKRIFVESFGDDSVSKQVQAMVISSLTDSKRFIVTENKERADAILRGSGLEKTSQELHAYNDSTAAGGAAGGHSGSVSGTFIDGNGSISGSSSGGFVSRSAAISDSSVNTETINDARIAVRLVDKDGDVLWATTQESKGAKYKGASADVADKVVKQLLRDVQKATNKTAPSSPEPKS